MAIQDRDLWNFINALHASEVQYFGGRYSAGLKELKGTKILKKKVFNYSRLAVEVSQEDIPILAKRALDDGAVATAAHLKALALAKLSYVTAVFDICSRFHCSRCASSHHDHPNPESH